MAAAQPQLLYSILPAHEHRQDGHVERPERVDGVAAALAAAGLLTGAGAAAAPPPAPAPLDELAALHSYVGDLAARAATLAPGAPAVAVADADDEDGATYMTAASFAAARAAAGAAAALVEAVLAPRAGGAGAPPPVGFSVARPPGHHATRSAPMGEFSCFLELPVGAENSQPTNQPIPLRQLRNLQASVYSTTSPLPRGARSASAPNVSSAASLSCHSKQKTACQSLTDHYRKIAGVLVLDFDVHHGNGTSNIVWDDPSVLFVDLHEAGAVYDEEAGRAPHGTAALGGPAALRRTINAPLPRGVAGTDALAVFDQVVAPAARRFRPDIILVSAGYDAHERDPFQLLQYASADYHALAVRLRALAGELCGGRLCFFLEGGYNVEALGEAVAETWRGLLGRPAATAGGAGGAPRAETLELIAELRRLHALDS